MEWTDLEFEEIDCHVKFEILSLEYIDTLIEKGIKVNWFRDYIAPQLCLDEKLMVILAEKISDTELNVETRATPYGVALLCAEENLTFDEVVEDETIGLN